MSERELIPILGVYALIFFFFLFLYAIITIVIWWRIFSKTGYSGALSLLMIIPIANFIMLLILAFGEWPIQKELLKLKSQFSRVG